MEDVIWLFIIELLRIRYAARQRRNIRNQSDSEQPPTYDNAIQEEDRIARQNVARYEMTVGHDQDVTDDRAPLTGP